MIITMRLIALLLCVPLICGCTPVDSASETSPLPSALPPPASPAEIDIIAPPGADGGTEPTDEPLSVFDPSEYLLGYIVRLNTFEGRISGHAFLRNAEGTGYPAMLYETNAVEKAIADGCAGVLVSEGVAETEIQKLVAAGCKVVSQGGAADADVSLYTDADDYSAEAARAMGEELLARNLRGGVLVIADAADQAAEAFADSFSRLYPQYSVHVQAVPLSEEERSAMIPELAGVYCMIPEAAAVWSAAKDTAAKELTPSATPRTSTPRPSPAPEGAEPTPVPTLAPHVAASNIVIIATDYTAQNLELLEDGGVFAIAARPYFDAAAQGMLLLDRLLRGVQIAERLRLNVPIIKKVNMAKYQSIVEEALTWMGDAG